jgi:acyl-CoA synthetase (AMP-forming)/AMP-acid ligase II
MQTAKLHAAPNAVSSSSAPTARTVYEQLARVHPTRIALERGDEALTYGELARRADDFAAFLMTRGVRPGDRVATRLRKGFEEVICLFAAARIGAVFVNIHPAWPRNRVDSVLASAQPAVLVADAQLCFGLKTDAQIVTVNAKSAAGGQVRFEDTPGASTDAALPPVFDDASALAALLYTSGSTGKPKGVMHSHANLVRFGTSVSRYLENTPDDALIGLLPISFSYGLSQVLTAIQSQARITLPRSTIPTEVVATLERREITGMAGVAMILDQITAVLEEEPRALPHLRYITNAGGPLPHALGRRLKKVLPDTELILMYGSTEALRSTFLPAALYGRKTGAIGQAIPGVRVDVVTADGRIARPNETGELVHSGDLKMLGYWQDDAATAAKLRPCSALAGEIGDEPVIHTGDLGYRDADGCLWFASRADWMIKSGGFRFSITELEEAAVELVPIEAAAAIAVDDPQRGQVVHLAVVLTQTGSHDEAAIMRALKRELPSYMWPRSIHILQDGLPMTVNGKLDRPALLHKLIDTDASVVQSMKEDQSDRDEVPAQWH